MNNIKLKFQYFYAWLSRNFICVCFDHRWEWWQLIEQSRCARCWTNKGDSYVEERRFSFFHMEREYRKLQTPFWKLSGQKATAEEKAQEKWMKWKNVDYYDLQRMRDERAGASYKKDLNVLKNPPKAPKIDYIKVPAHKA